MTFSSFFVYLEELQETNKGIKDNCYVVRTVQPFKRLIKKKIVYVVNLTSKQKKIYT